MQYLSSPQLTCSACDGPLRSPCTLICGHSFCREPCIKMVLDIASGACMVCGVVSGAAPAQSEALAFALDALRALGSSTTETAASSAAPPPSTRSAKGGGGGGGGAPPKSAPAPAPKAAPPAPAPPSKRPGVWTCAVCTLENAQASAECVACASPREAPGEAAGGGGAAGGKTPWELGEYSGATSDAPRAPAARAAPPPPPVDEWEVLASGAKVKRGTSSAPHAHPRLTAGEPVVKTKGAGSTFNSGPGDSVLFSWGSRMKGVVLTVVHGSQLKRCVLAGEGGGGLRACRLFSFFFLRAHGAHPSPLFFPPPAAARTRTASSASRAQRAASCLTLSRTSSRACGLPCVPCQPLLPLTPPPNPPPPAPRREGVREFKSVSGRFATLTFQYPDLDLSAAEAAHHMDSPQAGAVMDRMVGRDVFFEVLYSPRWAKFVAHRITLA